MITFELLPLLDQMIELYKVPISEERFKIYLNLLQGGEKDNLNLPIQGFNPMAKSHVIEKLEELNALDIGSVIQDVASNFKFQNKSQVDLKFKVAFNLADDLKGGWTNYFTTDFDSKFKINALVERKFCTPYFWTSETVNKDLIVQRVKEFCRRTFYFYENGKPVTLIDHFNQEKFAAEHANTLASIINRAEIKLATSFLEKHYKSDDYNLIFNFFYGDAGAQSLGFMPLNLPDNLGWRFLKSDASK